MTSPSAGLRDDVGVVDLRHRRAERLRHRLRRGRRGPHVGRGHRDVEGGLRFLGEARGAAPRRRRRSAPGATTAAASAAGPPGRNAAMVALAAVDEVRGPLAAKASRIAPMIRPRTRPESRKRTSALVGWTLTSTSRGSISMNSTATGMAVALHQVGIGGAERAEEQLVAHRPAVDEEELAEAVRPAVGRQPGEAGEPRAFPHRLDRDRVVAEVAPHHVAEPRPPRVVAAEPRQVERGPVAARRARSGSPDGPSPAAAPRR